MRVKKIQISCKIVRYFEDELQHFRMELKAFYAIEALLLLSLSNVKADEDFKQKFGDEFVNDMKQYHADLLRQNMQHLNDLFKTLLRDFEPTTAEEKQLKTRLKTIEEIQDQIVDPLTVDIVRKVKGIGKIVNLELILFKINPSVVVNPTKLIAIEKALEETAKVEEENLKIFQQKIYKRYHEMYVNVPNEELEANPEYKKILKILENVAKTDADANTLNLLEYLSVFIELDNLFDVPEYKELFSVIFN